MKKKRQQAKWIREGDKVVVIAGNDRGKTGTVLGRRGDRFLVQGVNLRKKAVRPSEVNPQGGIVEMEAPLHASNVRPAAADDKPVKLRVRSNKEGVRELYYLKEGKEQLYRLVKKSKK